VVVRAGGDGRDADRLARIRALAARHYRRRTSARHVHAHPTPVRDRLRPRRRETLRGVNAEPEPALRVRPVVGTMPRGDARAKALRPALPLVPTRTWYLPGCSYIHDLAMIGTRLHANSVGQNVVVALADGRAEPVWWPASIERRGAPRTDRNYIQLNSIAAGGDLSSSFFSASAERPGRLRPGHLDYPVDGRGVIYSGATREPVVRRAHPTAFGAAARQPALGRQQRLRPVRILPRPPVSTRGDAARLDARPRFRGRCRVRGTSRVIPRFRQYARG